MVQLTDRPEPINDGSDGGDGLGRSLERLVVAQLGADSGGDEREGTDDDTAEHHEKDDVSGVATVSQEMCILHL